MAEHHRDARPKAVRAERQVLFWLSVGLVFSIAVLLLSEVLLPFVAGLVIAYALNPLAARLTAFGLPRIAAALFVVALVVTVFILAMVFLVPLIVAQAQQLIATLPDEFERLRVVLEDWARANFGSNFADFKSGFDQGIAELSKNWASIAGIVAQSVWAQGRALIDIVALILIAPLVAFYVLVDWDGMMRLLKSWLPRDHEHTLLELIGDIDQRIAAFIRGQGLVCLILGFYYVVALSLAGLKYGLLVGIMTGVMTFVPFVGWALGLITSTVLAVVQSWPDITLLLSVLAIFAGAQALDVGVLSPNIVGSKIGLHPVWLIFALMVFSYLFGTVGVLVAVPMAAATGVLVRFALKVYLGSGFYRGANARAVADAAATSGTHDVTQAGGGQGKGS